MFTDSKAWLERQPGMRPWKAGCQRLQATLDGWLKQYSTTVCQTPVSDGHPEKPIYVKRLWQSLSHHWRQASSNEAVEVARVAASIEQGRGFERGQKLGGNPLRDMVLAVAMTMRDENAPVVFEKDYYDLCRRVARGLNFRLGDDPDQWWSELLDHLAGYTHDAGKLHKFDGKCGLAPWLRVVSGRFLLGLLRSENRRKTTGDVELETMPGTDDSEDRRMVHDVLEQMTPEERSLLEMRYLQNLSGKQIAALFGKDPGTISRKLEKARERFWKLWQDDQPGP